MKKKQQDEMHKAMDELVFDNFKDRLVHGVIVVSRAEMTQIFINLLADFIEFKRQTRNHRFPKGT